MRFQFAVTNSLSESEVYITLAFADKIQFESFINFIHLMFKYLTIVDCIINAYSLNRVH